MNDITQAQAAERAAAAGKILAQKSLSRSNVERLIELGHCASIYPRKGVVCVDGFRRYQLR